MLVWQTAAPNGSDGDDQYHQPLQNTYLATEGSATILNDVGEAVIVYIDCGGMRWSGCQQRFRL